MNVPDKCLICDAPWIGGAQVPGEKMPISKRIFYDCGASLSDDGSRWHLKNCEKDPKSHYLLVEDRVYHTISGLGQITIEDLQKMMGMD